jgi:hypothetical protein
MDEWWVEKIEVLKRQRNLNDVAVSRLLHTSPASLTHYRMARRRTPLHVRIRLLNELGYTITNEVLLRILPENVRSALIASNPRWADTESAETLDDPNRGLELPPAGLR